MNSEKVDIFADVNLRIRKAKALLRGAECLKRIKVNQRGDVDSCSLKLSTAVIVERLSVEDAGLVHDNFHAFCFETGNILERKAGNLINPENDAKMLIDPEEVSNGIS